MTSKKRYKSFTNTDELDGIKITPERKNQSEHINWFPGHMNKAIREIKAKLKMIDLVLELRDARAPMSTGNSALIEAIGNKNRLIIFNKSNLVDEKDLINWKKWLKKNSINFLFINALEKDSAQRVITKAKELILARHEGEVDAKKKEKFSLMMIGLPNTGKSTLINSIAGRKSTKTADKPGYTRRQQWIRVEETIELMDTPGIMPPKIATYKEGLYLAAIHAIPSKIVDEETTACFLIKYLLEKKSLEFQQRYNLNSLEVDYLTILPEIAVYRKCLIKGGLIDYERVYRIVTQDFREGKLGLHCFQYPKE